MRFTIIIATCGRPEQLARGFGAVAAAIRRSAEGHSIIVVDNGPGYPAAESVRVFAAQAAVDVAYLQSEPRNKARALNTGIRAAGTEWLAFTDDDTIPDVDWLRQAAIFAGERRCRVFGGRVVAGEPDGPLPRWLDPARVGLVPGVGIVVRYSPLPQSGMLNGSQTVPFGANFFVQKRIFEQLGGYDEDLWSLCGKAALGSEDAEFGMRMREQGEPIGYCHEAVVMHPVHRDRCTFRNNLKLGYYYGWREPILYFRPDRPLVERHQLRALAEAFGRALLHACRGRIPLAVENMVHFSRCAGTVACRFSRAYRSKMRMERGRATASRHY